MAKKNKYTDWTKEELVKRVEALEKRKKYGLVWDEERTKEKFEAAAEGKLPVLKEVKSKDIKTDPDKPTHILIEGDNYHALSVLNYTHENSVDVIYIDPPYNTGDKDFRYNDSWVDQEDSYRHSKWLSFMGKRLQLAKNLLKKTGVIFVSIDDNELAQLKLLMDEIFDSNLISIFIHKNNSSKNQANLVSISTEYMLLYQRAKDGLKGKQWRTPKKGAEDIARMFKKLKEQELPLEEIEQEIKEMYKRPKYAHLSRWNKVDEKGVFVDADLSREGGTKDYTITNPNTGRPCIVPSRGWGKGYDELLRLQKEDLIWYGDEATPPRMKDYLTHDDEVVPDSLLYHDNSLDTRLIKEMFGKLVFENPKPLEMIKTVIQMSSDKEAVILDFFSGTGTTGHAVMKLNKEDGGNRQFILCTNNENNICTDVCYPRIQKVIKGYKNSKGIGIEGLGGNLKYYRTSFVPSEPTDKNKELLIKEAVEMLCLREDTFEFVSETETFKIFRSRERYTGIIFDQLSIQMFKKAVAKLGKPVSVYVFSLGDDDFSDEFADMKNKIKVCSIPEAILRVYRRIFR